MTRTGISPTVEFPLSDETRIGLNYQLQSNYTSISTGTSDLIQKDAGRTLSSSAGYRLVWDQRDDPLQPSSGFIMTVSQQVAGLGGDTRSISTEATGNYFTPLDRDGTLIGSLKFWAGAVTKFGGYELERADRFYIGGSRLRGFAFGGVGPRDPLTRETLGGKFYTVASAELLSDVFLPEELGIRAGLFVDVGTIWGLDKTSYTRPTMAVNLDSLIKTAERRGGSIKCTEKELDPDKCVEYRVTADHDAHIRSSAGAQLLWASPVGPMQFVFSTEIQSESYDVDESFRFIIGAPF